MPLTKIDIDEALVIKYNGANMEDTENLKTVLFAESSSGKSRDIVLEFNNSAMMYSSEIGIIVQALKMLDGAGRMLRLAASNNVCEMLRTVNIHKIPNLTLHDSLDAVLLEHFPNIDLNAQ